MFFTILTVLFLKDEVESFTESLRLNHTSRDPLCERKSVGFYTQILVLHHMCPHIPQIRYFGGKCEFILKTSLEMLQTSTFV